MTRIIILGPQCSGKTTLARLLRLETEVKVIEQDEVLTEKNGGTYPIDDRHKHEVLLPKIEEEIVESKDLIFIASYFNEELLKQARKNGFKIISLSVPLKILEERNKNRMIEEKYPDASKWIAGQVRFIEKLEAEKLVDIVIDANKPIEKVKEVIHDLVSNI